jgi:hypothetical protein
MNFNIEKGIKLISKRATADKCEQIPLSQMVEGDSVFVPFTFAPRGTIVNHVSVYRKKTNANFTTRREKEGVRIFKLA